MFRQDNLQTLNSMHITLKKWVSPGSVSDNAFMVMSRIPSGHVTGLTMYAILQKERDSLAVFTMPGLENCIEGARARDAIMERLVPILEELRRAGSISISYDAPEKTTSYSYRK